MLETLEQDRVSMHTSKEVNEEIQEKMVQAVLAYADRDAKAIDRRLRRLNREWDMERWLEMNASLVSLTSLSLAYLFNERRLLRLPMGVMAFLLMHAVQGWCPPVPLLRSLGVRTQKEIDEEIYALKAMRGDFKSLFEEEDTYRRAKQAIDAARKL